MRSDQIHEVSASPAWQPPPRPDWVERVIEEGRCMDLRAVVPLDEDSLLQTAKRNTGLSDFGNDEWRAPFRIFIKALEDEAELHLFGRLRARMETLLLLEARLQVEDAYKHHPQIENEQIVRPIIVLGQGRCGSTWLQSLLGANPEDGAPRQWEVVFPCPPPERSTYRSDPRIARADKIVTQWYRLQPQLSSMTPFGAEQAFEDSQIYSMNFMSAGWLGILGEMPTYDAYVANLDPKLALDYHKRVLKLLQWRNPRRHWVLKDVHHLRWLKSLLQVYPDAHLVWIHRDPVRAMASMRSILGSLQRCASDRAFKYGDRVMQFLQNPTALFDRVIDQIESGGIPGRQIYHMHYRDLVADPMTEVQKMYDYHGIALSESGRRGLNQFLKETPRDARPPHQFSIPSGDELQKLRQSCKRYQEFFHVPLE